MSVAQSIAALIVSHPARKRELVDQAEAQHPDATAADIRQALDIAARVQDARDFEAHMLAWAWRAKRREREARLSAPVAASSSPHASAGY